MSDGNRSERFPGWVRVLAGAGLTLAAAALLGGLFYQIRYQQQAAYGAAEYARHTAYESYKPCRIVALAKLNECLAKAQREYELNRNDNDRNYADLVAQQRSALWTAIMGFAALIGMALSAVGVWLVYTTFRETKRTANAAFEANEISREALATENRAWLDVEITELGDWTSDGDSFRMTGTTRITNIGKTVALDARVSLDFVNGTSMVQPEGSELLQKAVSQSENYPLGMLSFHAFPNKFVIRAFHHAVKKDDIDVLKGFEGVIENPPKERCYGVAIVVIASYRTVFDGPNDKRRQTCAIWDVRRHTPPDNHPLLFVGDGDVPKSELRLWQPVKNNGFVT